ncbi:MAG: cation transporter [Candidatus Accumulibacter sp.]|nr:cation transporter [Accumulibacter sp.]
MSVKIPVMSDHHHDHDERQHAGHEHGAQAHHHHADAGTRLIWALLLTLAFAVVEALTGFWSGSLALLGEPGRGDARRWPPRGGRARTWLAVSRHWRCSTSCSGPGSGRTRLPRSPHLGRGGRERLLCAALTVPQHAVAAVEPASKRETRAAAVLGDRGRLPRWCRVVLWTGWTTADPLLSLLICALMLASSLRLLREVLQALMEGVPPSLSTEHVGRLLASVAGVASVHDLHIWTLSSRRIALSAHLIVESLEQWPTILAASRHTLADQGITHVTLQPEPLRNKVHWLPAPAQRLRQVVQE